VGMQSTFLVPRKYGKLTETTQQGKSLVQQKIERTRKQPKWRKKLDMKRNWKEKRRNIVFLLMTHKEG